MSIEFENVTKRFDSSTALDSVSFTIGQGVACGYIGPNGAGKTTTARIIVGLTTPDSGKVSIGTDSRSGAPSSAGRIVAYVPESPKLYESLTPRETIAMAAMLRKYDHKKAMIRLDMLSEIFRFGDFVRKPISGLSKGNKQKVVLSLALAFEPSILILDEPTDGLDLQAVLSLKQIIKSFTAHGGTVFYSSHLLDIVEGVCSQVYFINGGRISGNFRKEEFQGKRGYLENALAESIGTAADYRVIDEFFDEAD